VLLIGFINAGLLPLSQAIAPMLGANIGATLSVQLISFKLTDYCLLAVSAGLLTHLVAKAPRMRAGGMAVLGFGFLFLGLSIMSDSIRPHRALFEPWLAHINGSTVTGLLTGALAAALITGIIQSSGAVIGMGFALISAGVITNLEGIYPLIVGANIGTCVTGLIGSIGTTINARRLAIAHLLFNVLSAAAAIAAAPLVYRYIPLTSSDLIHQAANINTIKMLLSALLLLPFAPLFANATVLLVRSRREQPETSHLDVALLIRPEQALFACLGELQRAARICGLSLRLVAEEFIQHDALRVRTISVNEESLDAIKTAMRDYLEKLTRQYLSRRQAILIEHIDRCMSDLERLGDHIDGVNDITQRNRPIPAAQFGPKCVEDWLEIHRVTTKLLNMVIDSLNPEAARFEEVAKGILEQREVFRITIMAVRERHFQRLDGKSITPLAGMVFHDYLSNFWRMAKHIKSIALAEQHPEFWIKREKLSNVMSQDAPGYTVPVPTEPQKYLSRLQAEDYE